MTDKVVKLKAIC